LDAFIISILAMIITGFAECPAGADLQAQRASFELQAGSAQAGAVAGLPAGQVVRRRTVHPGR